MKRTRHKNRRNIYLTALALTVALSGCATTSKGSADSSEALGQEPLKVLTSDSTGDARSDAIYNVLVAELAVERNQLDKSVDAYMQLIDQTRAVGAARRATQIAIFAKQRENALVASERWIELAPDDFEAHKTHSELLIENEKFDQLLPSLVRLVTIAESGRGEGYAIVSTLLAKMTDVDLAIDIFNQLRAQFEDDTYANYHYVRFAVERAKPEKALEASQALVRLRPEWEEALKLDAQAHILAGQPDQALNSFQKLLQNEPDSWRLRLDYLFLFVQAGRYDDAFAELQKYDQQFGDNPEAVYQATRVAIEIEQFDYAKQMLVGLIGKNRRVNEAHFWLGRIEEDLGNNDDAVNQYSAVQDGQFFVEAHSRIAALLAQRGDFDKAGEKMQSLRDQRADMSIQLYLYEAEYLRNHEQYVRAKKVLDVGLEEHSSNLELRYSRALIAEKLDQLDVLEADLRYIIDIEPNSAHALNALGYTLADKTDRLKEAEALIVRAYQLSPEDFAIIDSIGWLLFRQGKLPESLDYLKRAYQASNDPEIAAHLVEVLWVAGEKSKAEQVFDEALAANPDHKKLNNLRLRLGL